MLKVGLTGGIGSGKSTVADTFAELGVPVIDTDVISHDLSRRQGVLDELQSTFGDEVIDKDGLLDRKALASIVFSDVSQRERLEAIMHPKIRKEVTDAFDRHQEEPYIIVVVPLLLETGFGGLIDRVLVVDIPEAEQLRRVSQRDSRSEEEILAIIDRQIKREERLAKADDIIDNSGDPALLPARVAQLHNLYLTA